MELRRPNTLMPGDIYYHVFLGVRYVKMVVWCQEKNVSNIKEYEMQLVGTISKSAMHEFFEGVTDAIVLSREY